ncbi:MAG: DUF4190 domain-containing protein [Clostridia bacterium]|nr:DUF4190 domain-containing protein [Clostridia bacterium]
MSRYSDEENRTLPTQYDPTVSEYEDKTFDEIDEVEESDGKTYDAEGVAEEDKESEDFYTLKEGNPSLIWSVLSLVTSVLSILLCPFYLPSMILGAVAIGCALISSRTLGFFNKMALVGLIAGIFGFIFGTFSMVLTLTGALNHLFGA